MGRSLRGAAAIVGVADAASPTGELGTRGRTLEAAMIREALDDAGLTLADVDGVCCSGIATGIAEYLDLHPTYVDGTFVGGSSFEVHVEHAAAAIAAGVCDVVVGVYAATPRQDRRRGASPAAFGPMGPDVAGEWETPYGSMMPMTSYALAADRHMAQYGTTPEQLAQIAVDTRRWAAMNPRARYRTPITVDDVLASPVIASPLHQLDCCLRTDGAGAYVLTSAERARGLASPPVFVLGAATAIDHWVISQMPDLTVTPGAVSGPAAFAHAGIGIDDVDVLQAYDSFTITALLHLEDLGFCAKGEGGSFVEDGSSAPVVHCRPTPTAAASRTRIRASTGSSCWWKRCASCAEPRASARCHGPRSPSPTVAAACSRPPAPWCSARRRRCDRPPRTAGLRRGDPVLGRDAPAAVRAPVVHHVRRRDLVPARRLSALSRRRDRVARRRRRRHVYAASVHSKPGPGRDAKDGPYAVVLVDLDAGCA